MKLFTIKITERPKETPEERKRRVQNDRVNFHTITKNKKKYDRHRYKTEW